MNVGKKITVARKSQGWTQGDLADKVGCGRSTIAMWESGKRDPDFDALEALADAFNCSMSYLLDDGSMPTDHELWEMRETCRRNPDTRTLFSLAKDATPADIKAAIAVLQSLKGARE